MLNQIDTPSLIIDKDKLESNLARMRSHVMSLGVALRPHMKTAKSPDIARLGRFSDGLTVSTLREAAYFADHGFKDIFYAVGISPQKLTAAADLMRRGIRLLVATDDLHAARQIAEYGEATQTRFEVMIEVDSGEGRAGISPAAPEVVEIANVLAPSCSVAGVFTHGGHSYNGRSPDEYAQVAEQERHAVTTAAEILRKHGHDNLIVSLGSTPSVTFARNLDGVTEVRPGVYMFQDLFQLGIGVCSAGDLALSVLTTVIGCHPDRDQFIVDAGSLAISKDIGTHAIAGELTQGYGLIVDMTTGQVIDGLYLSSLYQEHGIVKSRKPIDFSAFPVGRRLGVLMNHACLTAAAFDKYYVTRGNQGVVEDVWPRVNGWQYSDAPANVWIDERLV